MRRARQARALLATPQTSAGPSARSPRADAARPSCPLQDAAGTGWVFPRPRRTCLGGRSSQTHRLRSAYNEAGSGTRSRQRRTAAAQGLGPGQTPATRAQREGAGAGAVPAACRCLTSDSGAPPRPPRRRPPRATAVRADPGAPRLVPPAPALSRVQAQHLQRDSGCPAPSAMRGRF